MLLNNTKPGRDSHGELHGVAVSTAYHVWAGTSPEYDEGGSVKSWPWFHTTSHAHGQREALSDLELTVHCHLRFHPHYCTVALTWGARTPAALHLEEPCTAQAHAGGSPWLERAA